MKTIKELLEWMAGQGIVSLHVRVDGVGVDDTLYMISLQNEDDEEDETEFASMDPEEAIKNAIEQWEENHPN